MVQYAAAIDQGTTGTRFIVFDQIGQIVTAFYEEHTQIYPQPGWVEHDAAEIWKKTCRVIRGALNEAGLRPSELAGMGITNQRETVVVWDRRTGEPLCNAVVWQDTRTREMCQRLIADGLEPTFRAKSGLPINTYFSGPKLKWLLDRIPGLRERAEAGDAAFGTVDSWLVWNLTGGPKGGVHVTDVTNASRTMLMDVRTLAWDDELLGILSIPRQMLPEIRPSSDTDFYGSTLR
ncbi:MAG: FGGY family carbohydrate kinase, partial [Anaerolineae bacterium]|nr:FGGY family carbohydrate kinase [Anaerolineae bacterium]